jgi:hypothetical protein
MPALFLSLQSTCTFQCSWQKKKTCTKTLLSNTVNLWSSHSFTEHVMCRHTATHKIILHFWNRTQEGGNFWTELYQAFPEFKVSLISSWKQFWFIISKYLNFTPFSSDLSPSYHKLYYQESLISHMKLHTPSIRHSTATEQNIIKTETVLWEYTKF